MIRINVFGNNQAVKKYYEASLASGDYYLKDGQNSNQEMVGNWGGVLAENLGLSGAVSKKDFFKLAENINPKTGQELTARTVKGRRVGYDFNFHVPKSFSIMQAIAGDNRLTGIFREAVDETMKDMEQSMLTRVRKNGEMDDRQTGNMAWAEFIHFTARPVGGLPDPHLHAHCFVFNATKDNVEDKIKAGQFVDIKRNADLFQAVFHSRLMAKTKSLGYDIRLSPNAKTWEIDGVPQPVIDKFSRRTAQIEEQAKELGISNNDKQKEKLGSTTRENKQKDFSMPELQEVWKKSLSQENLEKVFAEKELTKNKANNPSNLSFGKAKEFVELALQDELERDSVVNEKKLIIKALMLGQGSVNQSQIKVELSQKEKLGDLIKHDIQKSTLYTTKELIEEEKDILKMINAGKNKYSPVKYNNQDLDDEVLSQEQKTAVQFLLNSTDAVTSLRGGAGTGKTTTLSLIVKYFDQAGKRVLAFAPSASASRGVLRDDGFEDADTVAKFLQSPKLQKEASGQIILIDEAGLLSVPQLKEVLETARKNNARVILSGDKKQHSAVQRGDALRIAEDKSRLTTAELNQTRRQIDEEYKTAVEEIRDGLTAEGLDRLDRIESIFEIENPDERYKKLAKDYADLSAIGQEVLVVTPTHSEGNKVNENIRKELQNRKLLGEDKNYYSILRNQNTTQAQRKMEYLQDGELVRFHRNFEGIEKGKPYLVKSKRGLDGKMKKYLSYKENALIPLWDGAEEFFNIYTQDFIRVSENEKLQITQNGFDQNGKPLINGQNLKVTGFTENGQILAENKDQEYLLPADFQDFKHGYYSTSHSSQGKTADYVLLAQSSDSMTASSQKQLYVSASRGRKGIKIYTDNKEELKENTADPKHRISALELLNKKIYQEKQQEREKILSLADKNPKIEDTLQDQKSKPFNPFNRNNQTLTDSLSAVNQGQPKKRLADILRERHLPTQTQQEYNQEKEIIKEKER
jgi:conjugative relaxase-like TrwC/TraI family protein